MSKSKDEVQKFIEALLATDYTPEPYSGRGMFGKRCVSVSGDGEWTETPFGVGRSLRKLANERWGGEFDNVPEPRQDQLGLGIVLYWPSFEWPKEGD